jgi:ferredoxin, 2Fe-2S
MPTLKVLPHAELCPNGALLDATEGRSICDVLLEAGIPIEHACDQVCACTTCHVIIREGFSSISEATEREEDMLDKAWGLTPLSRLSCQSKVAGQPLVVELPRYTINHARE